jgi:hypothetical protein
VAEIEEREAGIEVETEVEIESVTGVETEVDTETEIVTVTADMEAEEEADLETTTTVNDIVMVTATRNEIPGSREDIEQSHTRPFPASSICGLWVGFSIPHYLFRSVLFFIVEGKPDCKASFRKSYT